MVLPVPGWPLRTTPVGTVMPLTLDQPALSCFTSVRRSRSTSSSTMRSCHSTGGNRGRSLPPVSPRAHRRSRSSIWRFSSAANAAARSTIDLIFAALAPGVRRANSSRLQRFQGFLDSCASKMRMRVGSSGRSRWICRSKRPSRVRAGSNPSRTFVAAMSTKPGASRCWSMLCMS